MRRDVSPKIVVGPNDTMPDVLIRLQPATGGRATLAIPSSSSLFLTASEFRALKAAAEAQRIILTVETDDRLRRQLANMFHISVVDLLPSAVDELPGAEVLPQPIPEPPANGDRRRPVPTTPPPWDPQKDIDPDETEAEELPSPTEPRKLPISPKMLGIAAGGAVLLLILGVVAAFLLQSATVALTLRRSPVVADVTFGVVTPGTAAIDGVAFTVNAEPVTFDVPFTLTVPVTGVEREPDQIAGGTIALRNTGSEAIEIAAGTTFTDRNGVEYEFTGPVTVPAGSEVDGPGRAIGSIQASLGGEAANRDTGLLSGQLENGIYYSNRDGPIAGGTDFKRAVVAQEDIDGLLAAANQQLPEAARNFALPDGRQVVPGTVDAGEFTYTLNAEAGDPADSITIDARMTVQAFAFSVSDVTNQAAASMEATLTQSAGAGSEVVSGTVSYGVPELVEDRGAAAVFRLQASADTRPLLSAERKDEIARAVAGKNVDDATVFLQSLPEVAAVRIESSPGFLPARIPGSAGKIEIETS